MKILIAYTASGTSDNPFVRLLADGIRACGYEVVCSVEEFRSNAADYDIVHLQWPEELFRWKAPAPADVDTLEQQLQTLKNNGIPLIYTRHNTLPHHGNPLVAEAYGLVERYADAIVHLGDCSLREFTAAHPDSEQLQVMIPHHIYEGLYDMDITRDAGRRAIADPRDYEARATLMWAGSVSHNDYTGCGRKRLFPVHKLEHELSAFRDEIAHGAGLSVLFPAWAEHEMPYDYPRFAQFANRVLGVEMDFEHPERTAREGIRTLRRFFEEIGMPTHLSQLGIKPENYEKLAANTVRTVNGPVKSYSPLDEKAIIEIYRLAE